MPTRPSAAIISSRTIAEALGDVLVAGSSAAFSASSRWSSAGSSSLASLAIPRSDASAFSRAIRLR